MRAGRADYPSLYNFLGPVLKTGASANYEEYSNPEFDKLLTEGLAAKSTDDANAKFTQAQEILFQDLPNLPLVVSGTPGRLEPERQQRRLRLERRPAVLRHHRQVVLGTNIHVKS